MAGEGIDRSFRSAGCFAMYRNRDEALYPLQAAGY